MGAGPARHLQIASADRKAATASDLVRLLVQFYTVARSCQEFVSPLTGVHRTDAPWNPNVVRFQEAGQQRVWRGQCEDIAKVK